MRALKRPLAPECLQDYDYVTQIWDNLSRNDYCSIRQALSLMQGGEHFPDIKGAYCGYCECRILGDQPNSENAVKQHIEHFRRRRDYKSRTFQWDNLFLSCYKGWKCGRFKDSSAGEINYELLIKPDEVNPEEHLLFKPSGRVIPRDSDPTSESHQKAKETIRVFNLNASHPKDDNQSLIYLRKQAIDQHRGLEEMIAQSLELLEESEEEDLALVLELIREELEALVNAPYFTAIKHSLLPPHLQIATGA